MTDETLTAAIHSRMRAALPAVTSRPPVSESSSAVELERFHALVRDYPGRMGKTVRGRLVVLSARAHGAAADEAAIIVAAALELFQAWVLVHDDIEDDSETRRGEPALHRLVGMPIALNVGDALHVHMWRLLHQLLEHPSVHAKAIIDEFATMIDRTAEGQHLDLTYVETGRVDIGEAAYLQMVTLKTAYYTVVAPLRLGALLAGAEPDPALTRAGIDLGVAFQIRDDVLNLRHGSSATGAYGKEFAGDLYEGKRTLIIAHLLASATPDEAAEVRRLLAGPRTTRDAAAVTRLLALIDTHGSLDHAQRVAADRAASGLDSLRSVLAQLPGRTAAERLVAILDAVAVRDS
jgi:geranylgeranyl diphosphate synthase type II